MKGGPGDTGNKHDRMWRGEGGAGENKSTKVSQEALRCLRKGALNPGRESQGSRTPGSCHGDASGCYQCSGSYASYRSQRCRRCGM